MKGKSQIFGWLTEGLLIRVGLHPSMSYKDLASNVGERKPRTATSSAQRWWILSPIIFGPLIPLTRILLRKQPPKVMNRGEESGAS